MAERLNKLRREGLDGAEKTLTHAATGIGGIIVAELAVESQLIPELCARPSLGGRACDRWCAETFQD